MKRWLLCLAAIALIAAPSLSQSVHVKGATVWTQGPEGTVGVADLLIVDGKIKAIGTDLKVPRGVPTIDATGKHVTPGPNSCY